MFYFLMVETLRYISSFLRFKNNLGHSTWILLIYLVYTLYYFFHRKSQLYHISLRSHKAGSTTSSTHPSVEARKKLTAFLSYFIYEGNIRCQNTQLNSVAKKYSIFQINRHCQFSTVGKRLSEDFSGSERCKGIWQNDDVLTIINLLLK